MFTVLYIFVLEIFKKMRSEVDKLFTSWVVNTSKTTHLQFYFHISVKEHINNYGSNPPQVFISIFYENIYSNYTGN